MEGWIQGRVALARMQRPRTGGQGPGAMSSPRTCSQLLSNTAETVWLRAGKITNLWFLEELDSVDMNLGKL